MEGDRRSPPPHPKPKFSVYQNPNFSAALTANSLRSSTSSLLLSSASVASALALFAVAIRILKDGVVDLLNKMNFSYSTSQSVAMVLEISVGLVFIATAIAFLHNVRSALGAPKVYPSGKRDNKLVNLSDRQLGLLGLKSKAEEGADAAELAKKPPKSRPALAVLEPLVPIRKSAHGYSPARVPRIGSDQKSTSGGKQMALSPISPASAYSASPSTPWSKSASSGKGILTEEMLEQFLADADEKIVESAVKAAATPPATLHGFGIASPSSVANSATTGATRSTPLRPVRMSPGSQKKYGTPPKKGEGELPPPLSMEQAIEGFNSLGIYPQIELWRDRLRQWFSSVLLKPFVEKIETSHIQVMQAAAAVGVSITVNQVGTDSLTAPATVNVSPIDGSKEWQPTFTLDDDGRLHQLRATLVQARDGSVSQVSLPGGQPQQQNPFVPIIQACIDAIAEHQRLNALMKGELVKGLLPQSTVRADYTVKRVRELAEGTCVKNYEYMGIDDKSNKKWTQDLPLDSHFLAYLFCAFLDHPKWMLHVDPTSYTSTQSSKNPLFLGFLPPKDRFPEKYVAVISGIPSVIHPGACILVIGKQNPPIFTLYWDKKLQFSLQGRTALWDAVLLLCHRIKLGFGGVVRGLHLGSPAFNILPIFESETES